MLMKSCPIYKTTGPEAHKSVKYKGRQDPRGYGRFTWGLWEFAGYFFCNLNILSRKKYQPIISVENLGELVKQPTELSFFADRTNM